MSSICLFLVASLALAEPMVKVPIEQGDNLIKICATRLENQEDWREVAKINKISRPYYIYPNQEIMIPVRLLKGSPMPARATLVAGLVRIREEGQTQWARLSLGQEVSQGTTIKTGPRSGCRLEFEDGASVVLNEKASFTLESASKKQDQTTVRSMFLRFGRALVRVGKKLSGNDRFQTRTPTAVCGVRGTDYRLSAQEEGPSRTEVLGGLVEVEAQGNQVDVAEGQGTVVEEGKAPLPPRELLPSPKVSGLAPEFNQLPRYLSIEPLEGALFFRVRIAGDAQFVNIVQETKVRGRSGFWLGDLPNGDYWLRVTAVDDIGLEGMPSETHPFTIRILTQKVDRFVAVLDDLPSMGEMTGSSSKLIQARDFLARFFEAMPKIKVSGGIGQMKNAARGCGNGPGLACTLVPFSGKNFVDAVSHIPDYTMPGQPLATGVRGAAADLSGPGGKALILVTDGESIQPSTLRAARGLAQRYGDELTVAVVLVGATQDAEARAGELAGLSSRPSVVRLEDLSADEALAAWIEGVFFDAGQETP